MKGWGFKKNMWWLPKQGEMRCSHFWLGER
jgi:hypothetical protein